MVSHTTRISLTLAALLVVSAAAAPSATASDDASAAGDEDLPGREQEVLHTLLQGDSNERLEAAENICTTLQLCFSTPRDRDQPLDDLIDGLILALRQETDDWIARTLLEDLVWDRNPGMGSLFREALRSPSVNVQAMGVRRFAHREDPEAAELLEAVWEQDHPRWMNPALIEALAEQGSTSHLDDFMRLTRDDDAETREAAIEALDTLALPEAIPVLIRVSRSGPLADRAAAIEALGAFPDSEEALQEVLRASRSGDRSMPWAAVRALGRLDHPDGDARLIALLETPPDPDMRSAIAEALEDSDHPDTTAALVRLLHQPDVDPVSWIASTAVRVLHNRDDAGAVPGLLDLASDSQAGNAVELSDLIAYLSRDPSVTRPSVILTSHCSFGRIVSAESPRVWHVQPPPPLQTIRCWEAPDRAGDPEDNPRLPAGTLLLITDHFEARGEHWVEIEGSGHDCWVPLAYLERGPGPPEPLSWPRRHIRHEFDLGTEELESPQAVRLAEAGLLEVFDPGEVAGVALELDAFDADPMDVIRGSLSDDDSLLDAALRAILRQAAQSPEEDVKDDGEDTDQQGDEENPEDATLGLPERDDPR